MDPWRDPRAGSRPALSPSPKPRPSPTGVRARILRWLRPPRRLRPTRAGWNFFAITFGVGFAALNTGNNLLYLILALMLSFLVLSGVLSESALRGIRVRRRLPREFQAGAASRVILEIENRQQRVPAFAVVIEDWVHAQGAVGRVFCLRLGPMARVTRSYRCRPERRGELNFLKFQVSTRFPFGLFSKSLELDAAQNALVYPAIQTLPTLPRARERHRRRQLDDGKIISRTDGAVATGLRDYAPGDPARRIHWRASLRRGALQVRQLESEQSAEHEVRLRTAGRNAEVDFESHVVGAASQVAACLAAGRRVSLRTDRLHFEPDSGAGHRARLLGFLATVEIESQLESDSNRTREGGSAG